MKSQDLLILLKLLSLEIEEGRTVQAREGYYKAIKGWQDWDDRLISLEDELESMYTIQKNYSVRALSQSTGISKSEISLALQRCYDINLAKQDLASMLPRVNKDGLLKFIIHGLKYVFPAKIGRLSRGIATSFAAPVFNKKLMTAGDTIFVWPDAHGKTKGQSLTPLYKSVPYAVRRDAILYELLALIDAIRIGGARERNIAIEALNKYFEVPDE